MPKTGEYVKFKNFERKIKSPFMILKVFYCLKNMESKIQMTLILTNVKNMLLNKELVMTKTDNEDFENSTKCWICDNDYIYNDVKVRDHCYTTRKYRGSAHRDCNINVKLNHKIPVVIHNLKNYNSHLIMN